MARHKLTIQERLRGARKLLNSKKVNAGLKKWAREFIRRNSVWLVLGVLALAISPVNAHAQRSNVKYADQFFGSDVGTKVTAAQAACTGSQPCVIVIDTILANWPAGSIPNACSTCIQLDYRDATQGLRIAFNGGALQPIALATPVTVANGGTGQSTAPDDNVLVGNGTLLQLKALTTCTGAGKAVTYDAASNAFGCNTISSAGYTYNSSANRWELFDSIITTALLDANPGINLQIVPGTYAVNIGTGGGNQLVGEGPELRLGSASGGNTALLSGGKIRVTTGAVLGNDAYVISAGSASGLAVAAGDVKTFVVTIDAVQTNTATMERVGFYGASGGTDPPTQSFFLEKANADTTWFLVACTSPCSGGTQTRANSGVTVAAGKVTFIVVKNSTTSLNLYQKNSNTPLATVSTNIPADSQQVSPFFQVRTNEAVAKSMDLYYFNATAALTGY